MLRTNRYEGLIYLKRSGLPVPDLIKIDSLDGIKSISVNDDVRYGWTIRTCKRNGLDEYGLFFQNNLDSQSLIKCLIKRLVENKDEYYIVYPSWDMMASYNIIAENGIYVIEGGAGSQKSISLAQKVPQYSIIKNFSEEDCYDNKDFVDREANRYMHIILSLLRTHIQRDMFYVEVAVTKTGEIYFYEYRSL